MTYNVKGSVCTEITLTLLSLMQGARAVVREGNCLDTSARLCIACRTVWQVNYIQMTGASHLKPDLVGLYDPSKQLLHHTNVQSVRPTLPLPSSQHTDIMSAHS